MKEQLVIGSKRILVALVFVACGFAGAGAFYLGATLYEDHQALKQIIGWVNAVNAQAQRAQGAQGQPGATPNTFVGPPPAPAK